MDSNSKQIKAFILCGGRATRLQGLNGDLPKSLMKVDRMPVIAHLLLSIEHLFNEIFICHAHQPSVFDEHLKQHLSKHLLRSISYKKDLEINGTAFAVQRYLPTGDSDWAVFNGDTLFSNYQRLLPKNIDRREVVFSTSRQKIGRSNVLSQNSQSSEYIVHQNRHGTSEKVGNVSNGIIFLGPDVIRIFKQFELHPSESLERALLRFQSCPEAIFSSHSSESQFLDFGTPSEFTNAESRSSQFLFSKKA